MCYLITLLKWILQTYVYSFVMLHEISDLIASTSGRQAPRAFGKLVELYS